MMKFHNTVKKEVDYGVACVNKRSRHPTMWGLLWLKVSNIKITPVSQ